MGKSRGDLFVILKDLDFDIIIKNEAKRIFDEHMKISLPRTDLAKRQLTLVCLHKAVIHLGKDLTAQYIATKLGLSIKERDSGLSTYTDFKLGCTLNLTQKKYEFTDYLSLFCERLGWSERERSEFLNYWNNNPFEPPTTYTTLEIAAAFLLHFLDNRAISLGVETLEAIVQVQLSKVQKLKVEIAKRISDRWEQDSQNSTT